MIVAGPAHAAACAAIHAAAFPAALAWGAPAFAELLAAPGVRGLIEAERGAALILVRAVAGEAEILTLATAAASQRRGLARALLGAALHWAAGCGATEIFLEVSDRNTAAYALYAQAGFEPCGRRPRYYADGSDALVLRRPLGE